MSELVGADTENRSAKPAKTYDHKRSSDPGKDLLKSRIWKPFPVERVSTSPDKYGEQVEIDTNISRGDDYHNNRNREGWTS